MKNRYLVIQVLIITMFLGIFNHLLANDNLDKWSPKVGYSYENNKNSYILGLDYLHNNKLIGFHYEKDTKSNDFILSLNTMVYKNNKDSKYNIGVGLEGGGRKGTFMLSRFYMTPKLELDYKDISVNMKYRDDTFIYTIGYSF